MFGVEARATGPTCRQQRQPVQLAFTDRSRVDAFGLFTARVGYAFNNVLLYVKGGAAVAADRYDTYVTLNPAINGTASKPVGVAL